MKYIRMKQPISTVDQLVDAFGGTGRFADWCDVGPSTVSNWKALGYIPSGYHLRIYLEALSRGLQLSPRLFGFEDWPPAMGNDAARTSKRASAAA